jgi:hypothetical protein
MDDKALYPPRVSARMRIFLPFSYAVEFPLEEALDSTRAQVFPGPSTTFLDYVETRKKNRCQSISTMESP